MPDFNNNLILEIRMSNQKNEDLISPPPSGQEIHCEEDKNPIYPGNTEVRNDKQSVPEVEENSVKTIISLSDIFAGISTLKKQFDERLSYDKTKEEAFEHLYKELDEFKKNNIFNHNRPLYIDIILLFDRIENIRTGIDHLNSSLAGIESILGTLSDEILEILYRQGIEIIIHSLKKFDPTIQRAIGVEKTFQEEENNQIARIVRRGFRFNNQILRAEEVLVLKYVEV